jgi:hypothetical protein
MRNMGAGGETSTQIRARMLAEPIHFGRTAVIWAGRNNYGARATVLSDIAAMVAALGHGRFLVLSVPNGDYASEYAGQTGYGQIIDLNDTLAATWPDNYLDIRRILVDAYDPGQPQDVIDHGRDIVPASKRADAIHLNATGNAVVKTAVHAALAARGW